MRYFDTIFLEQAEAFLSQLDRKTAGKVIYNIDLAEQTNDYKRQTLVVATHGFIKKADKVPANEIERAEKIRVQYFKNKSKK